MAFANDSPSASLQSSLRTSLNGQVRYSASRFHSREVDRHAHHGDGAFHRGAIEGACERDVRRALIEHYVDGETEFVAAEIAANDVRGAAVTGQRAGNGAVLVHGQVSRRFLSAFRRGVGKLPLSGKVAFRRILWF